MSHHSAARAARPFANEAHPRSHIIPAAAPAAGATASPALRLLSEIEACVAPAPDRSAIPSPAAGLPAGCAIYLYALVAEPVRAGLLTSLPSPILPGALTLIPSDGITAIVSIVSLAAFAGPAAEARDPAWVAARAAAHHAVVAALHRQIPCLPLGFGTLFPSAAALHTWIAGRASPVRRFLAGPAACEEYILHLTADTAVLGAWLESRQPALREAAQQAATASAGRAFLLRKQLGRLTEAACRAQIAALADMQLHHAASAGAAPEAEPPVPPCLHAWRLLLEPHRPPEDLLAPPLTALLAPGCQTPREVFQPPDAALPGGGQSLAAAIRPFRLPDKDAAPKPPPGISLRLTGPLPPYGHARAALETA